MGRRMLILARPYEGARRRPTWSETLREKHGDLVGLDLCAVQLTGLPKDETLRRILIEAGRNTFDLAAPERSR
jgi:hypothetical protein